MQPRGINIIHLEDQKLMKEKINPKNIKLKGFSGLSIENTDPLKNIGGERNGQRMSNSEWLTHLCDYGHPVAQCMIMQAIYSFADTVIASEDQLIEDEEKIKSEGGFQLLSNELWVEIAKWLRLKYHYQYENKEEQSDAS